MSNYLNYLFVLLVFTCCSFAHAETIRRAAFDFGSGKIKVQIADVDTDTHKILNSIYSEDIIVLLSEDSVHQPQGMFSREIQDRAVSAAKRLKQKSIEYGAIEFKGLATEAYRKAPNSQELVDRYLSELGIPVVIISQEEEGKNGFLALIAETNLDPTQVIAWDIGGGSFQVTYLNDENSIQVYMAPFGRMTTKNAIIEHVKGWNPSEISSPNPMSLSDWNMALDYFGETLPEIPEELAIKLKRSDVQVIGISAHPEQLRLLTRYNVHDISAALEGRLDKTDSELAGVHKAPETAVSELVLVYSILQKLQAQQVNYVRTHSGSTSALLISEEYWNQ